MKSMLSLVLFALIYLQGQFASALDTIIPQVTLKPTNYQIWAHYHWAWLVNDAGNQANVTALMEGYQANQIPLGCINIDSTWATQFNNFEVDSTRFPDFAGLVKQLHDNNIKVILWTTSMVNVENPDYDMCVEKGYLIRDSKGFVRPIEWWHGKGGLLDYTNPDALAWWHSKMDQVLDVGVDGFKCDGTDPYIMEYTLTGGALGYNDQVIDFPTYAHLYYRDFFYYTREKRTADSGSDAGLIMSRPVDCFLRDFSKGCLPFSPKDVMYSGWVGDDNSDFQGMRGCVRKAIYSSWLGYANYGCDIGGYRGGLSDRELFIRWIQLGSFMPLMENGGGGEHRPWMYDEEVVTIYRKYAVEHHRLASYLHTNGANAVDNRSPSIHPVDTTTNIIFNTSTPEIHIVFPQPKTYSYRLGDDIVIHPVMYDDIKELSSTSEAKELFSRERIDNNTAIVDMVFPEDDQGTVTPSVWLDWWHPNDLRRAYKANERKLRAVLTDDYPVYVREGSLLPLHAVSSDANGILTVDDQHIEFTWFHPSLSATESSPKTCDMRESITTGTGIRAVGYFTSSNQLIGEISSTNRKVSFVFVGVSKPSDVQIDAMKTAGCLHVYQPLEKSMKLRCENGLGGVRITLNQVSSLVDN